ncbi:pyrroline-5-carboxylate reductase [Salibacterium aidingense]|uniref:pyrroline-5-carboxylate reductase n=1 Tax=Salibacterium aidingense TaxID=384933 RepID=UPI000408C31E|nr:pyrroline-5-carboxylate reductase [Salibacterium aidingense]
MIEDHHIAFIGAGSMAASIIGGLLAEERITAANITATNHSNTQRLTQLEEEYGIRTVSSTADAVKEADIIVLAVKPKHMKEAAAAIKPELTEDKLVMSVLAGIKTSYIEEQLDFPVPVIRAMPNTSAQVGESATALSKGTHAVLHHLDLASSLFSAIGTVTVFEENHLDAVTGISGSGPAYFYYFVEAMEQAAAEAGLPEEEAHALIIQTIYGAASRLRKSNQSPRSLYNEVMSPGGTTEAAFQVLEKHHIQELFQESIQTAISQSKTLGRKYDNSFSY